MKIFLKRVISKLPVYIQQQSKKIYFGWQIKRGVFLTDELEYGKLQEWVNEGDVVLDIGANVGHYSCRLSEIVGLSGRVFAFEPVPQTFELLTANVALFSCANVTLFNVAASDTMGLIGISVSHFDTGLINYYRAQLSNDEEDISAFRIPIDRLCIPYPVALVKIDVEGHEMEVLKGMEKLLTRDHPVLIIEGHSEEIASYLKNFGYSVRVYGNSPNSVFKY